MSVAGRNEATVVNETFRALRRHRALELASPYDKEKVFSELRARNSWLDWSMFVDALGTVERVPDLAYKLGDQVHDGLLTKANGFERLLATFPELDRDVLDHAYGQGLYESSK